ncbi:hypothetical protein [Embleya sp. NBC_00896]|uniref:hypothetical protein n=1 Tax=Embleya sp. NBC_00896 TaxID=2975961 RepID=UPI003869FFD1|nr:hypothetical protein OG928_03125 [Embleya sp. NBC_00896]
MSRGYALPGAAVCVLSAVLLAIVVLTACGGGGDAGRPEVGTTTPAAAVPVEFASMVAGAQGAVERAEADAMVPDAVP